MKITVTAEHIAEGRRNNCHSCPVALALKPYFPSGQVHAGILHIYIYDQDKFSRGIWITRQIANTPRHVGLIMEDFDSGAQIRPFEFELDLIPEVKAP